MGGVHAGPESRVLEGVSWDEARQMQDAQPSSLGNHSYIFFFNNYYIFFLYMYIFSHLIIYYIRHHIFPRFSSKFIFLPLKMYIHIYTYTIHPCRTYYRSSLFYNMANVMGNPIILS